MYFNFYDEFSVLFKTAFHTTLWSLPEVSVSETETWAVSGSVGN